MCELPFFLVSKALFENLSLAIILLVSVENALQSRHATFFGQNLVCGYLSCKAFVYSCLSPPESKTLTEAFYTWIYAPKTAVFSKALKNSSKINFVFLQEPILTALTVISILYSNITQGFLQPYLQSFKFVLLYIKWDTSSPLYIFNEEVCILVLLAELLLR